MENAVRLPRLPPVSLEIDPGMVDDAVVVDVRQYNDHGDCVVSQKERTNKIVKNSGPRSMGNERGI